MRYIAAYLLLQTGGNASPKAADIKKVLSAGGVDVDEERLTKFLSEVDGKSIDELVAAGSSKLSSVGDRERLRRPLIWQHLWGGLSTDRKPWFFFPVPFGDVCVCAVACARAYRFRLEEVPGWRRAEVQPLEVVQPLPKPPRRRRRRKKPRVSPGGSIFARRRIGRRKS